MYRFNYFLFPEFGIIIISIVFHSVMRICCLQMLYQSVSGNWTPAGYHESKDWQLLRNTSVIGGVQMPSKAS